MDLINKNTIYTIGHSTRPLEVFIQMLQSFKIKVLADIRGLPGSRKFPQFDKENLVISLKAKGITYFHLKELGGRRKVMKDSKNKRWHNTSFQAYADHMETAEFHKGILQLEEMALKSPVVYMCAEAVWWRCHRSLVSDYLKAKKWDVWHIMGIDKAKEHSFTKPARVKNNCVFYFDDD